MAKEETDTFRRVERYHGHFSRSLALPENADEDNVDAECINGVLHVMIPKKEVHDEALKKIEVK